MRGGMNKAPPENLKQLRTTLPLTDLNQDTTGVEQALARFIDAFTRLDWEAFRLCWVSDPTTFFPHTENHRAGGKDFDKTWQKVFSIIKTAAAASGVTAPPYHSIDPMDLEIMMLGGDAALATFHLMDPRGTARRTIVLKREHGEWLLAHLHASIL